MGTRLYVQAKVVDVQNPITAEEILAGVPAGTAARLAELEQSRPRDCRVAGYHEATDAWYEKLMADDDVDRLNHFQLFGYGRVNGDGYKYIESLGLDPVCGSVSDTKQMNRMLKMHGVDIPCCLQVTDVSWG